MIKANFCHSSDVNLSYNEDWKSEAYEWRRTAAERYNFDWVTQNGLEHSTTEERELSESSEIRKGLYGKNIRIFKLRTMKLNSEKYGVQWSQHNDKRVTKIGYFLRKTRIDEIPQLISVLKGEMSLIGPRPERPEIDNDLKKNIPCYENRYNIKPGISGWAQVNYPYGASVQDSYNKLSYDLFYVRNCSIFIDLLILFKTIRVVIKYENASFNS